MDEVYRVVRPGIALDLKEHLPICDCAFWEQDESEPWHYLRLCWNCGNTWYSLHCPHDGYQNKCTCGARSLQVCEYEAVEEADK